MFLKKQKFAPKNVVKISVSNFNVQSSDNQSFAHSSFILYRSSFPKCWSLKLVKNKNIENYES
jgi:hypothetical protein